MAMSIVRMYIRANLTEISTIKLVPMMKKKK